jgi:S-formylglutathione hydrolase
VVYLPPSYETATARRYPVLYLLHGFGAGPETWLGPPWSIRAALDRLVAQRKIGELIVVMPDAGTKLGGAFFTDSASAGDWEAFVARDLVAHVDRKYRTRAAAASRGVAGHSMGGYGALRLAFRHPDVFAATYALSPCCLAWEGDLGPDAPGWDRTLAAMRTGKLLEELANLSDVLPLVYVALATAWSPAPDRPPFHAALPFERRGEALVAVPDAHARWSANLLAYVVDRDRAAIRRLRAVGIDVGRRDEFTHIVPGCRALAKALDRNGIRHRYEEYDGGHVDRFLQRLESVTLPFFAESLEGAAPSASRSRRPSRAAGAGPAGPAGPGS